MLTIEELTNLGKDEFISTVHRATVLPSNIITFVIFAIVFLALGLLIVKENRDRLFLLWFLALAALAMIMFIITLSPSFVQYIAELIRL